MQTVHCVLQGKGGVGKSFVSLLLAQYLMDRHPQVLCIDTDPINATFASYKSVDAEHLRLMQDETFDYAVFDGLLMRLLEAESPVVIDNGAASFGAMVAALADNNAAQLLAEHGKTLLAHCLIAGADNVADAMNGFNHIAERLDDAPIICWLNEYHGEVTMDGKRFEQMRAYERHRGRVQGIAYLRKQKPNFEADLHEMMAKRLTFDQALERDDFNIIKRSRLGRLQNDYFNQIALVLGPQPAPRAAVEEANHAGA